MDMIRMMMMTYTKDGRPFIVKTLVSQALLITKAGIVYCKTHKGILRNTQKDKYR